MPVIETRDLSKQYKRIRAVDGLSLHMEEGTIYGFLGLNGAGKTTTMRMLLGMIKPTGGTARIFGRDCQTDHSIWSQVGYMVESTHAYPELTVEENLNLFYAYRGLKNRNAVSGIIGLLKLDRYQDVKARYLSLGNLQRLGLAKALMHKPKVLILDEPVNGLDPVGIIEIRELLSRLAKEGTTILMSSHLLSEIARIADTIGIIHHGVLISELKSELLHMQLQRKLIIETNDPEKTKGVLERLNTRPVMKAPGEWEIQLDDLSLPSEIIASTLVNEGIGLRKLNPVEEDLESFFLRIIQGKDQ